MPNTRRDAALDNIKTALNHLGDAHRTLDTEAGLLASAMHRLDIDITDDNALADEYHDLITFASSVRQMIRNLDEAVRL